MAQSSRASRWPLMFGVKEKGPAAAAVAPVVASGLNLTCHATW